VIEQLKTSNDTPWWIVETKPRAEFTCMKNLKNQGFTSYCPIFKKEYIRGQQLKINTYPLFSRYIFVEANHTAELNIHVIRSTLGVSQLLKIAEVPTKISCKVIYKLRQMELKKFKETKSHFNQGDHVKIKEGIYQNLEAVFHTNDGHERAVILLSLINKETSLRIDKRMLQMCR
jgi:transcriptional antiterminator RfaH